MGEEEKKKPMEEKANKQQPDEKNPSTKDEEKKQGGVPEAVKEAPPPPPPPQEVVLKVFMHCEGCAKKVRRSLKGFPGVEDVITDSQSHKVVVKGEKADPVKVMERIQRKSHRKVELISPIPKPPEEEKPKAAAADQEGEKPKEAAAKEKEEEEEPPQVIAVVLKVHMHCEACSLAIKKRILRMKGVESVETDLKSSQVTVVGVFYPAQLVDYLHKRTGKQAAIVKQEPTPPDNKKEGEKGKDVENKQKEDGKICGEQREGDEKKAQGTEAAQPEKDNKGGVGGDDDEKAKLIELNKNEFYYYPAFYAPRFAMDQYYAAVSAHPPQLFSDENPNACNVM